MATAHDNGDLAQEDKKRPYSIDLSLELERQLDNESLPPTPAAPHRPQSIDQTVLTSLVVQLRQTLAEVTSDRDQLRERLARAESDKDGAEEALHQFTAKCAKVEDELEEAKVKMRDDEHAISMLRTKVEESRRGLMRLQSESRRAGTSSMSIDTARAGYTTPLSSKRASFVPLTGRANGHNRVSSISDSAFLASLSNIDTPGSPDSQAISLPDLSSTTTNRPPPVSSRRFSGLFGMASPPQSLDLRSQDPHHEEMESLRREMKIMKSDLEETRHELSEATEAKEASETCAKALRDFIAQTQGAASYSELDLLPSQAPVNKDSGAKKSASGWGAFRMWKMEAPVKPVASEVPVGSRRLGKVDTTAAPAPSSTTDSDSPSSLTQATPTAAAPFTTKVGSFFGSRASISSSTSHAASISNLSRDSDVSSTDSTNGPISPLNEIEPASIMVRGSSTSSLTEFDLPQSLKVAPDQMVESTVLP